MASVIPGFWLDIDIKGPNHYSENLPPDVDSAMEMLDRIGLEPTLVVKTGGGLHVYWLFNNPQYNPRPTESR